ncbi:MULTISPECIES: peptidylprolyl isomerase [Calothrix]|uniref:peptidylprolyl isomerase n=2 Tax=Calothrix TaxID=1186 RepID=A0ABR8AFD4_9CYAN|nr:MULTISPECIES: peptidylprolyl isomerase [Calothrix]MBD2198644.1 peptidylprolyl isomerase [Calothrix parietina FACHB-288]MBD2227047.1 peptidylprolyl isomerase [Calothrix anomala FACHB-343]
MSQNITIIKEDILREIKLSCKIPEVIEQIISRKVIISSAVEAGITIEPKELQHAADQIRLVNNLDSADDTWKWLEKHSLSLEDFENIVYSSLISGKLAAHLFSEQVEPYFFEHQLDYSAAVMYQVILDSEDLALELFYAIKEDEISFHDVAHKYIQDVELKRSGGYQGIVRRKDMKPEISAAVFAANPPQILKPIVNSQGYHLILVEEIIQPILDDKLRYKIITELFAEWLKKQIDQFEIELILD